MSSACPVFRKIFLRDDSTRHSGADEVQRRLLEAVAEYAVSQEHMMVMCPSKLESGLWG